jgi:exonuclease SbcD
MFRFIHAADIHLDSPLKGLDDYEGAPVEEIRLAARRAFARLVDLAIEERVAFVLIAGDLYDGEWRDFNTGHFFIAQASRLRQANIGMFLIAGNHDAHNKITKALKLPDNCRLFPSDRPHTEYLAECAAVIHGQSFANAAVYEDLSLAYPKPVVGAFNIGMLHTSLTGSSAHDRYAPCTLDYLVAKGYDYWALGHIHQREVLSEAPFVAFSGNIQGRHARETGAKGCFLVTVDSQFRTSVEFRELGVMRWETLIISLTAARHREDALDAIGRTLDELTATIPDVPLALRLELTGATAAHRSILGAKESFLAEVRAQGIDRGQGRVWIEKVNVQTTAPSDVERESVSEDAVGELRLLFQEFRRDPQPIVDLRQEAADILRKLPAESTFEEQLREPAWLSAMADEAEAWLMQRLLQDEDAS